MFKKSNQLILLKKYKYIGLIMIYKIIDVLGKQAESKALVS